MAVEDLYKEVDDVSLASLSSLGTVDSYVILSVDMGKKLNNDHDDLGTVSNGSTTQGWLFQNLSSHFYNLEDIFLSFKYRVVQKSGCQVGRKVLPWLQPAMPSSCLTKYSLFTAQPCIIRKKVQ